MQNRVPSFKCEIPIEIVTDQWGALEREMQATGGEAMPALALVSRSSKTTRRKSSLNVRTSDGICLSALHARLVLVVVGVWILMNSLLLYSYSRVFVLVNVIPIVPSIVYVPANDVNCCAAFH